MCTDSGEVPLKAQSGSNEDRHIVCRAELTSLSLLCCRHGDGAYYEHGPRTLRPSGVAGANTLQLIEEIGLGVSGIPVKYIQGDTSGR